MCMISVSHDSTVFKVHTIFAHPLFGLAVLPTVTPLIPLLNDTCSLCRITECAKRVTLVQGIVELSRYATVVYAVGKLFHLMECLP